MAGGPTPKIPRVGLTRQATTAEVIAAAMDDAVNARKAAAWGLEW